ncbi:MAG: beta-N-acetylhexosaminidase [Pelagibacterales bacterium]|nr:beta-N-acetylhexosaminidase [Pelagibacterales bacterium]|tara:strand:+ start:5488 stop:6435 length:948 start_codon:yes stop_codon:yes gene_type:complete
MIRKAAIISISGVSLTYQESNIFRNEKPWGVILFKRNISSEKQLRKLTNSIKQIMKDKKYPILIDEEGGRVTRLSNFLNNSNFTQKFFGDIYKINKNIGLTLYKNYINLISKHLQTLGININTSPVLDLLQTNSHGIIGNRSYSENLNVVKELGCACIKFYKKNKIATVIKHIPGHGRASVDSHFKLPIVNGNLMLLKKNDFECFKNTKSYFAMTAHILYSKIDNVNNATHSKTLIKEIIRKKIGFKGILISDDVSMKALKYDVVKNAKLAHEAGCNLILYCAGKTHEVKKILKEMPYIDAHTKKKTSEFYKFLS